VRIEKQIDTKKEGQVMSVYRIVLDAADLDIITAGGSAHVEVSFPAGDSVPNADHPWIRWEVGRG
jgi:hypothetical protein